MNASEITLINTLLDLSIDECDEYFDWLLLNKEDVLIFDKVISALFIRSVSDENKLNSYYSKLNIEIYSILIYCIVNEHISLTDISNIVNKYTELNSENINNIINELQNLVNSILDTSVGLYSKKYKLKDYIPAITKSITGKYNANDQINFVLSALTTDEINYINTNIGNLSDLCRINTNHAIIESNVNKYSDMLNSSSEFRSILTKIKSLV